MPSISLAPARTARLLHLALMGSVVGATVILASLPNPQHLVAPLFLYAVFGVAAVLFAGALVLSGRLPQAPAGNPALWWSENLGRTVVIWTMLEGPSLLGAVAYLLSRDATALVVPGIGVALLVILGPSRLEQG